MKLITLIAVMVTPFAVLEIQSRAATSVSEGRHYHNETVDSLHASRHTHVRVVGLVTLVRKEADGDVHFRIADEHGHFVVCEIVPYHPLPIPVKGQVVVVAGIRRFDDEAGHGFDEIHPVEVWHEGVK